MTSNGAPQKGRSPEDIARWRAMRAHVLPNHLAKPVSELEEAAATLETLLKPRSAHGEGFAARYVQPVSLAEKRAAFEAIIAKADAVHRYLRMEQTTNKDEYDNPCFQPMLDGLQGMPSIEDD